MQRIYRIEEEELRQLTTQLDRTGQQNKRIMEELGKIRLQETERECHDKPITISDIIGIINPSYVTERVEKSNRFYVWVKDTNQGTTYKLSRKNVKRYIKIVQ